MRKEYIEFLTPLIPRIVDKVKNSSHQTLIVRTNNIRKMDPLFDKSDKWLCKIFKTILRDEGIIVKSRTFPDGATILIFLYNGYNEKSQINNK